MNGDRRIVAYPSTMIDGFGSAPSPATKELPVLRQLGGARLGRRLALASRAQSDAGFPASRASLASPRIHQTKANAARGSAHHNPKNWFRSRPASATPAM